MKIKKSFGEWSFDIINCIVLILLCIVTLYPILYVVFASLSEPQRIMANTGLLWRPLGFSLASYKAVFANNKIWLGYRNTIFYVVVGTAINIFMTSLAAYALSRKNLFWGKYIMRMILFTMYFGGGLIPTYLLMQSIHFVNTIWAMIIPGAISVYNFVIMRTSFAGIPDSIEEAAKIDGANEFAIMFRIVMPLSIPIIMVMVLYYGVGHWNSWFNAMIYLNARKDLQPLQIYLREILMANDTASMMTGGIADTDRAAVSATIKYATIMVATVPILLVYPFIQRYFVKGVMIGAVKG